MASNGSTTPMDCSNDTGKELATNVQIPGGDKKILPEEPQPSGEPENTEMGCGLRKSDESSDYENVNPRKQQKTEQNPRNSATSNKEQKKPKVNDHAFQQSKSTTISQPMSDDENDPSNQSSNHVTRSSVTLSKLNIKFDDSDDDETSSHFSWAKRDIAEYRSNYPDSHQEKNVKDNYNFYTNKMISHPDGDLIDNIHKYWRGDYHRLEMHHGYIQWLFPLQERGLNWSAEKLQKHEIDLIKKDDKALKRILTSYELMLDFYGFRLIDKTTGELGRSSNGSYKERFRNLNSSSHNYLRITRILKCLGEFDYEYLKFPFLAQILFESIIENTLPNCLRSCKDYWIETLRSQEERRAIRRYAKELLEYRNKGIRPPKSHRAERPQPASKQRRKSSSRATTTRSTEDLR
ncbi:unnamed protein product [Rotaria magnacalcarata]|uniref:Opioid growth factor receptor (OGFr) conserved domain-containing protein n=2 Tax=Rotaria magnacalcarata TaxID=392030 RepID=A0A815B7X3_9BILA|nr:unnamed protein product [Rotaria magnacalcarata]CAF1444213.1 unnamed protein product [Rotaria magnacalcarata]CAF1993178.1 unnamed protein product [Rotaria magnacalcarata]CAF2050067.1 unnamed protein product [Rotaria magnacalcarata]